jgi:hypothetical protein
MKVFIAGAPRSGTSILVYALRSAVGLPGHGESHVTPLFYRILNSLHEYLAIFESYPRPLLIKELPNEELEEYILRYVREFYAASYAGGSWIDKTPNGEAVLALPMVERAFPDARLIVTKRNGIEVVTSHLKKFNASFEHACGIWAHSMDALLKVRSACKNLLVVDQFDFSNHSDRVAEEIANHIGVPEKTDALAQYLRNQRVEHSSAHDWRCRLRLDNTSWTDRQKDLFKDRCGNAMAVLGYEL